MKHATFIKSFIGLRSKSYQLVLSSEKNTERVKNISKGLTKTASKTLSTSEYLQCLKRGTVVKRNTYTIKAKNHRVTTRMERRVALASFDIKRRIFDCGIHSLPWGSKETVKDCSTHLFPCSVSG